MASFQVSQSKVKKWRQCRRAYHYRYVEHLKRKIKSRPLSFGIIVHELLEFEGNRQDPFDKLDEIAGNMGKLFAAEREMYGELIEDVRMIFEAYLDYWADQPLNYIRWKGQRTEHWIEIELCDGITMVMKIDAFTRSKNKLQWLTEHKTGKNPLSIDDRWRNLQSAVYFRACEIAGAPRLDGVLWNFIVSKPPTRPQILKSGGISTRQIVTLPAAVRQVIKENKLDPKDSACQNLLRQAEQSAAQYFQRDFTPLQPAVVDSIWTDFVSTCQEMAERHGTSAERTIDKHCSWCDYEPLCRAELTGGDVDFVKEREYDNSQENNQNDQKKVKQTPAKGKAKRGGTGGKRSRRSPRS